MFWQTRHLFVYMMQNCTELWETECYRTWTLLKSLFNWSLSVCMFLHVHDVYKNGWNFRKVSKCRWPLHPLGLRRKKCCAVWHWFRGQIQPQFLDALVSRKEGISWKKSFTSRATWSFFRTSKQHFARMTEKSNDSENYDCNHNHDSNDIIMIVMILSW